MYMGRNKTQNNTKTKNALNRKQNIQNKTTNKKEYWKKISLVISFEWVDDRVSWMGKDVKEAVVA